jgi:hypothetical protein
MYILPSPTWTSAPEICLENQPKHLLEKKCAFREAEGKFSRFSHGDLRTSSRTNSHNQEMEGANQFIIYGATTIGSCARNAHLPMIVLGI